MTKSREDPLVTGARREAVFSLLLWAAGLAYTMVVCYSFAPAASATEVRTIAGIPTWVVWGVLVPWAICLGISFWFAFRFMADADLTDGESSSTEAFDD